MSRINEAVHEIHHLDAMAQREGRINRIHPLSKLLVTVWYIAFTMLFPACDLSGTFCMILYPAVIMRAGNISVVRSIRKLGPVLLLVCAVGIANPFFDRAVLFRAGPLPVTGGMISMATLMLKGVFAVLASYLIYRYVIVLLKEAERISQAYSLRAPAQKGIHYRAWGTLLGQLMLRSIDRAQTVYESMLLRGFDGSFHLSKKQKMDPGSAVYLAGWLGIVVLLRYVSVFKLAGSLLK